MKRFTGGCLCGDVQFEASGLPVAPLAVVSAAVTCLPLAKLYDRSGNTIEDNTTLDDPQLAMDDRYDRIAALAGVGVLGLAVSRRRLGSLPQAHDRPGLCAGLTKDGRGDGAGLRERRSGVQAERGQGVRHRRPP